MAPFDQERAMQEAQRLLGTKYTFAPPQAKGVSDAISASLANSPLAGKQVAKGLEVSRRYTWDETARRYLALYDTLG